MTAIIEAIVWFCSGTAAGLAICTWFWKRDAAFYDGVVDELLASNQRLRGHIAWLEKKRERDSADWWKDS